jgi:hypothetical protein
VPSGSPRADGEPFAGIAIIHPPHGRAASPSSLIKAVLDYTVAGFQVHGDQRTVGEISCQIEHTLAAKPAEVARWLTDERVAVLGTVAQLVHLRAHGVQWAPGGHDLVVGDVRVGPSLGDDWALSGEVCTHDLRR